jgi:hypothetical protein
MISESDIKIVKKFTNIFPDKEKIQIISGQSEIFYDSVKAFEGFASTNLHLAHPSSGTDVLILFSIEGDDSLTKVETIMKTFKPFLGIHLTNTKEEQERRQHLVSLAKTLGYLEFANDYYYCPNDSLINSMTIVSFWTGTNALTPNRLKSIETSNAITRCKNILIKHAEIHDYIMDKHPLHPAYEYLSFVHKADYLRTYFMHFYGGGYTDIKGAGGSWISAFKDMMSQPDKLINGYQEIAKGAIVAPHIAPYYELVGNCCYICRPNSELTKDWYGSMIKLLDERLPRLKLHPAKDPRDCAERGKGYPIEWNEMLGRIFHSVISKYGTKIIKSVPKCIDKNYR